MYTIPKGSFTAKINKNFDTKVVCGVGGVPTAEDVKYKVSSGAIVNKVRGYTPPKPGLY